MPSSTSSSDPTAGLPRYEEQLTLSWRASLTAGVLALAAIVLMEAALAIRGFQPSPKDSAERWAEERQRASALGDRAAIVVGTSRALLGIDTTTLAKETGLQSVQLAIDGSGYESVLADLAADPEVRGLILVSHNDAFLLNPPQGDRGQEYPAHWQQVRAQGWLHHFTSAWTDYRLELLRARWMRSFADGATPILSLRTRLLPRHPAPQYRIVEADRSVAADFSRTDAREQALRRTARTLTVTPTPAEERDLDLLERDLRAIIDEARPADLSRQAERIQQFRALTAQLQAHGARVIYFQPPVSGLLRDYGDRALPKELGWDRFAAGIGAGTIHYAEHAELSGFQCPDNSHLDYRDRAAFTHGLLEVARQKGLLPAPPNGGR